MPAALSYHLAAKLLNSQQILRWLGRHIPVILVLQWLVLAVYVFGFNDGSPVSSTATFFMLAMFSLVHMAKEFSLAWLQGQQRLLNYNRALARESAWLLGLLILFSLVPLLPMYASIFVAILLAPVLGFFGIFREITTQNLNTLALNSSDLSSMGRYTRRTYPGVLLAFANNRWSIFFISAYFSMEALGIFSIALMLTEKIMTFARSAALSVFPRVSGDNNRSERYTPAVSSIVFWATALACALLALLADRLVPLLYGEAFKEAATFIYILALAIPFFAVNRILAQTIAGRGRPELNSITTSLSLAVNIAVCFCFHESLGLQAVALAYAAAMLANLLAKLVIYRYMLRQPVLTLFIPNPAFIKAYLKQP